MAEFWQNKKADVDSALLKASLNSITWIWEDEQKWLGKSKRGMKESRVPRMGCVCPVGQQGTGNFSVGNLKRCETGGIDLM